jgi:hypothetical protein
MKDSSAPILHQNTAEWLDPSQPGVEPILLLSVLTPTHDCEARAQEHGHEGQWAFFGETTLFPDDSASYDAHISSERNITYEKPTHAGTASSDKLRLYRPTGRPKLKNLIIHEVQHIADHSDSEAGHDQPYLSPEESWNRYKTEFRAWWIANFPNKSTVSGTATDSRFDNEKQEAIFFWFSDPKRSYSEWFLPNYQQNTKVGSENFQDLVHSYTRPEGVNLINSPRIEEFFLQLEPCKPSDKDLTQPPLKALDVATDALNAADRTYINSTEAARLHGMMKTNLDASVLKHIATKINNGTEPDWAK